MTRQIRPNAFHMNTPGHSWAGLWAHPRDRSSTHDTPGYWTHLARTAERGKLDAVFLADVIGVCFEQVGGRGAFLVGSPATIADEIRLWVEEADIDGFNLVRLVEPENLEAIVDLLVPELQARGLFKTEYAPGPLRQKLTGRPRLPDSHPGARHRFPNTAEQEPTA